MPPLRLFHFPLLALLVTGMIVSVASAEAAVKVWDGGGANDNWSTALNWSGDTIPSSSDSVIFSSMSTKNATIPATLGVASINIYEGYTGTITLTEDVILTLNTLTIGSSDATVRMGTDSTLVLTGSGGTPLSGSGTLDATTNVPNSILYKGEGVINIPGNTYNRLTLTSQLKASGKNVLTLQSGENNAIDPIVDPGNGFLYAGLCTTPAKVAKINTSDFTRVSALAFNTGEDCVKSAAIDTVNGFAYFGTDTSPAQIVKVRLSDFSRVGSLTLNSGENGTLNSMAVDTVDGFLYMATASTPSTLVKIRLSDFTRVASLTLQSSEQKVVRIALDTQNGFAYLGMGEYPGILVKVRLSDLTRAATVTLSTFLPYAIFVDPPHGVGYVISCVSPSRVVKFRLSDLTELSGINMGSDYSWNGAIDTVNGYLYALQYRSYVDKVRLSDFTRVDGVYAYPTGTTTVNFGSALDVEGGYGYMVTSDSPAKIFRFVVSTPYHLGTAEGQTLTVENGLFIGSGSQIASADASVFNPTVTVGTNLFINSGASLKTSTTAQFTVTGNWLNQGRFYPNNSVITFTGTSRVRSTGTGSFHSLSITSGTVTLGTSLTVTTSLSIGAGSTLNLSSHTLTATTASITNLGTITESTGKILHPATLSTPSSFTAGETVTFTVTDSDENIDGSTPDTITLTIDRETITLTETGNATGIFTGSIPSLTHTADTVGDGYISRNDVCAYTVIATVTDIQDASDASTAWISVTDPVTPCPPPAGGGRGSRSPGREGSVPLINPSTRTLLPTQPITVSPLYGPANNVPPAPAGIISPLRDRLAARIEKRITQYPRLRTTLLRMLERLDRRLQRNR